MFRAGSPQPKAVPLSLVTRLEEIAANKIELSNGRYMVQYRGQLMPLVQMIPASRVKTEGAQPLLVFSDDGRSMGLVVDEIVDIVEDQLDIEVASDDAGRSRVGGDQGAGDRGDRCRPFSADGVRGLVPPQGNESARLPRRSVLLVDDCAFFRNMLAPVLQGGRL